MHDYLANYSDVTLKLIVGLAVFLLVLRTTGRGSLSQMTPIDLVSNFVMGGIIGGVIYNPATGILHFLGVLFIWEALVILVNYSRKHFPFIRDIVAGGDLPLVIDGKYQIKNFKRIGLDVNDFVTMLRIKGAAPHEVAFANFESNGSLSVIKKEEDRVSVILIKNGEIIKDNLELAHKTEQWVQDQVKKQKVELENIYLAEWFEEKTPTGRERNGLFIVPIPKDSD
ncbi:DUF421 domain-containing protein [Bartonella sp. HY329]|uniref:DUF421 domain-containing protein n=1 Tax=unclassified Bartonella TaxID=2645622 RepID=UPI0021C7E610|nr:MULTISPECIES: YetF domain-containing protein [unclassified Bartonella]UXM94379.1 DUF421 domain-containing protein [Bartonella sp. HY329]UXN08702.1 DUF421 domain-containing protein [Bartonella sp. HY328]